ncbi:hypothetical protein B0H13DRAFT_2255129 [Mycena leptocephala]|nr:hypothetical protein B0H13DRAFT_2255129 [Mycena leptocephala]
MLPFLFRAKCICGCSSLVIPVHVDVLIPKDPADVFADVIQLLVHGFTYTSQYWSPPVEEFRNYSYVAFSCDRGFSRPVNASDVQYLTGAAVVSQLARHLKNVSIFPGVHPFKKIIAIGHSAGSILLNVDAIVEGARSPFDGLILTASLIVKPGTLPPVSTMPSARDVDPHVLSPDTAAFSPRMFIFDDFTKDVGSVSTFLQVAATSLTTRYMGPVAKVVGSEDQLFCAGNVRCLDVAALTATEQVLWPDARSFEVVVAQQSGHDLNLDFFAQGPFNTFVNFVNQFSAL